MNKFERTKICDRCGEIRNSSFRPAAETYSGIGKVGTENYVDAIVRLENVDREEVEDWMHHFILKRCVKLVTNCPNCGGELATPKARQCLHCHQNWFNQRNE